MKAGRRVERNGLPTIPEALYRALHSFSGAMVRWGALRSIGASDDALRAAIAEEFGIHGGDGASTYSGGANPRFWLGYEFENGKTRTPTLQGRALVDAARAVLKIPQPQSVAEQGSLFP